MKQDILELNTHAKAEHTVASLVSFRKFIAFLEEKLRTASSSRADFYRQALEKLAAFPELAEGIPVAATGGYKEILELVAAFVLPLADNEDDTLLALTNTSATEAFYATSGFRWLMKDKSGLSMPDAWIEQKDLLELHREFQYNLVLQKVYGQALPDRHEVIHSFIDPVTGLYKYYRMHIDTRFVEVTLKPGMDMPAHGMIDSCMGCINATERILSVLPLAHFVASGFCIITMTDVTVQQSVEQLGKALVRMEDEDKEKGFTRIMRLLQTIVGDSRYKFGVMPFFYVNHRAALPYENFSYSLLLKASFDAGISKPVFTRYTNQYIKKPEWIVFRAGEVNKLLPEIIRQALLAAGYTYYALMPVFFNKSLVGIFEVAAAKDTPALNELQAARLKPALPLLSQLLLMAIDKFNKSINDIVKEQFTNIQPSVQWKFNEVAWHYFRSHDIEHKSSALEKVSFEAVHPLYGAVDIRNSTVERNRALRQDLQFQLGLLKDLLAARYAFSNDEAILSLIVSCQQWHDKLQMFVSAEDEIELTGFLDRQVHPTLNTEGRGLPAILVKQTEDYFLDTSEQKGQAHAQRRQLENSMKKLNKAVGRFIDASNVELQQYYPFYFEKFRTDGIEYDIYIGQSIAPRTPFNLSYVQRLHRWQLQSMAAIAKITRSLQSVLEYPLETTQLIFINPRTIDIVFRNDERRFDVEGAYNIRYHIVKKRIDKVLIRDTTERLTQPGKIAVVYYDHHDADEYLGYIRELQQEGVLQDDLEQLQLEELQGVAGLRALRVGVLYD